MVEYKTDWKTATTNNVFIETISVDTAEKLGWFYTSRSQVLIYFVPQKGTIYCALFQKLRIILQPKLNQYPLRRIQNDGYCTVGRLIPIDHYEPICHSILYLPQEDVEYIKGLQS